MQLWIIIFCIIVCGVLSALFSGLSLGIMMLDTLQLNLLMLVSDKDKKELNNAKNARKILPLRNNTNQILVTFITANVMVNSAFSLLLNEITDGFTAFIVSTLIITIFGEIIPQSICSKHGLAIGGFFAPLIHFLKFALYIFAKPISLILDHFVGKNVLNTYNKKELKALVDMHKSAVDILHEDEAKIVGSALEMSQYKVKHIMTDIDYVFGIDYNSFINYTTIKKILKSGFSRIPVLNRNQSECVVGLIHIKDLINIWFGINKIIFDNNYSFQSTKKYKRSSYINYRKKNRHSIFRVIKNTSKVTDKNKSIIHTNEEYGDKKTGNKLWQNDSNYINNQAHIKINIDTDFIDENCDESNGNFKKNKNKTKDSEKGENNKKSITQNEILNPSKLLEKKRKKIKKMYKNPYTAKNNKNMAFVEFLTDQMVDKNNKSNNISEPDEIVFADIKKKIRMYNNINKKPIHERYLENIKNPKKASITKEKSNKSKNTHTDESDIQTQVDKVDNNQSKENLSGVSKNMNADVSDFKNNYFSRTATIKENLNKEKNIEHIFLDIKNYIRITRNKDIEIPVKYILKHIGRYIYGVDYDESVLSLLSFFKNANNHFVVVRKVIYSDESDPKYSHIGITTLEDVIEILLQEEISDEFDFIKLKKGIDIPNNFIWKNSYESVNAFDAQGMSNWDPNRVEPNSSTSIEQTKRASSSGKTIMEVDGIEHSDTELECNGELDKYSHKTKQENLKDSTVILISNKKNNKKIEPINYKKDIISFLKESIYFKYIDTHLMNKYIHGTKIYTLNKNEYLLKDNTFLNYAIIIIKGKVKNLKSNSCTNGDKCFIGLEALGPCNIIELFNSIIEKRINVIKNYEEKKKKKNINILFKKWYTQHVYFNKITYITETDCKYILLSKNEYMDMIIESYENNKVDEIIENS
ncbi:protein MAM3, putative [Plasmodium vinckei vinckei]|uniref:Protein MAM3, putative n=1 Tax=Plasmodium vinckei vinckei TaxID=54757 RepID=A0A449BRS4_PLAVN|nr:protein MAM3, putative [Plasmodium vinckei vinckei]VEV56144.1 protein MAM3, putative [Plasmodium vinckei vinckei]